MRLIILLMLVVCCPGPAAAVAPELPRGTGIEVNLRQAGPLAVDVILCNVSNGPLLVNSRFAAGSAAYPVELVPELLDSRGKSRTMPQRLRIGQSDEFAMLAPGRIAGVRLQLGRLFGRLEPGRYTLRVTYRNAVASWQGRPAWRGHITAKTALEIR